MSILSQGTWGTDSPPEAEIPWAYALVAALGHIPAAIEIVASTLRRTAQTTETYLRRNVKRLNPDAAPDEIVGAACADALESLGGDARDLMHALSVLPAAKVPLEVVAAAARRPAPSAARPLLALVHARLVSFHQESQTYALKPLVRDAIRKQAASDAERWSALHEDAAGAMQALLFWTAAVEGRPEAAMRRRVAGEVFRALDVAPYQDGGRGAGMLARALVDACTVLDLGLTAEVQQRVLEQALQLAGDAFPEVRARAQLSLEGARRAAAELAQRKRGALGALRSTQSARDRSRVGHRELLRRAARASEQRPLRGAPPAPPEEDRLRAAKDLLARGSARVRDGALEAAAMSYDEALALLEAANDGRGMATALLLRGDLRRRQGALAAAARDQERALLLFRAAGDRSGEALALVAQASLRLVEGDTEGAATDYDCALTLLRACRDRMGEAYVLKARGDLCFKKDDLEGAARDYDRALYILEGVEERVLSQLRAPSSGRDERRGASSSVRPAPEYLPKSEILALLGCEQIHARTWQARGDLHLRERQTALAVRDYGNAILLYRDSGDLGGEAVMLKARGDLRCQRGALPGALRDYDDALQIFEAFEDGFGQASVLKARGDLRCNLGDMAGAARDYHRALALFSALDDRAGQASITGVLASLPRRADDGLHLGARPAPATDRA